MSDLNPYAAPQSVITPELPDGELPYAPRLHRFGAALLDAVILFPVNYLVGMMLAPKIDQAWATEVMLKKGYLEGMKEIADASTPSFFTHLLMIVAAFGIYIGINWVFLKNGQTIGKKVAKVQVQKRSGGLFTAQDLVLRRLLPIQLAASIPGMISPFLAWVGGIIVLVDCLCIFRADFNTLHDDIAKSKVVKLPA